MNKKISFNNYLKYFYDRIKVNSASNPDSTIETIIFFKIEESNLHISFNYLNFYITTVKNISLIEDEYKKHLDDMETDETIQPFKEWLQEKYLDNRGIEEI